MTIASGSGVIAGVDKYLPRFTLLRTLHLIRVTPLKYVTERHVTHFNRLRDEIENGYVLSHVIV